MNQSSWGTQAPESFEEFVQGAEQHYRVMRTEVDSYRRGQAYSNYLAHWHPEIAREVDRTPVDPFHQDSRVNAFLQTVRGYFE